MEQFEIQGKRVYVVERHHFVLEAWAQIKRSHEENLTLITVDRHTDTHYAFDRPVIHDNFEEFLTEINERIRKIDYRNDDDIRRAIADLRNDQHIDAAIRLGLFSFAVCINDNVDFSHWATEKNVPRPIFEVCEWCLDENDDGHDRGECERHQADQVIESAALERLISRANDMASPIGIVSVLNTPYVLDIDLDYFRTMKALSPKDARLFYEIIRNALAITIATEPHYLISGRLDRSLTSDVALEAMLNHIRKALA